MLWLGNTPPPVNFVDIPRKRGIRNPPLLRFPLSEGDRGRCNKICNLPKWSKRANKISGLIIKKLQPYANNLRKRMTKAEACLWKYVLRASKMKGYGFRRQRPIMNYIADFMSKDLM